MTGRARPARAVVVIAGPQASGKSAVAAALADDLRRRNESVALVELDRIAAMALPTLPDWEVAQEIFASVVGQWSRSDVTCVVAEGSGTRDEVQRIVARLAPPAIRVIAVTTAPFDVAFARAQADPARGVSRDYDFLRAVYERWPAERDAIGPDLRLDTSALTIAQSVDRIRGALAAARDAATTSTERPRDAD